MVFVGPESPIEPCGPPLDLGRGGEEGNPNLPARREGERVVVRSARDADSVPLPPACPERFPCAAACAAKAYPRAHCIREEKTYYSFTPSA